MNLISSIPLYISRLFKQSQQSVCRFVVWPHRAYVAQRRSKAEVVRWQPFSLDLFAKPIALTREEQVKCLLSLMQFYERKFQAYIDEQHGGQAGAKQYPGLVFQFSQKPYGGTAEQRRNGDEVAKVCNRLFCAFDPAGYTLVRDHWHGMGLPEISHFITGRAA
jgi:hypothetical protein